MTTPGGPGVPDTAASGPEPTTPARSRPRRRLRAWLISLTAVILVLASGAGYVAHRMGVGRDFPAIDSATLSPAQARLVEILEQQFDAQHPGAFYSEGVAEPWCADFVSWNLREAGMPLVNPHSQSWRIPGVFTLAEYFQATGAWRAADSGYSPKLGDVVLYDGPGPFGQHTNFVLLNNAGELTTIGGNELGKIRVSSNSIRGDSGVLGYGVLTPGATG